MLKRKKSKHRADSHSGKIKKQFGAISQPTASIEDESNIDTTSIGVAWYDSRLWLPRYW